jgi:cyanophycin synthetase
MSLDQAITALPVDDGKAPLAPAPMRVIEKSVYRGPHLYSATPMIRIQLDLGDLERWPTDRIPAFAEALTQMLPSLAGHGCSYKQAGGFVRRLNEGTWIGHVVEHVALELQSLSGTAVTRGKTRSVRGKPGVYNVLYAYCEETVGLLAGLHAIRLVDSLLPAELRGVAGLELIDPDGTSAGEGFELEAAMRELQRAYGAHALGPTTSSLAAEARRRGIPVLRVDEHSLIQLGYGSRQKRLRASITGDTSHIAVETAGDKNLTKQLLADAGLPVPRGAGSRARRPRSARHRASTGSSLQSRSTAITAAGSAPTSAPTTR